MRISQILLTIAMLFSFQLWAADDEAGDAKAQDTETQQSTQSTQSTETTSQPTSGIQKTNKPGVLDFEAELIEGERKSPDMFLQLQSGTPNLDAILFQRTNFNDFHNLEKHRRPLYRRYVK